MADPGKTKVDPSAAILATAAKNAAGSTLVKKDASGNVVKDASGNAVFYKPTAQQWLDEQGGVNAQGYYINSYNPVKAAETAANKALGKTDYSVALAKGEITPSGSKVTTGPTGPTTSTDVLKSLLKGLGFNASIIDSSTSYLTNLLSEGLDYDNAVSVFLNSKDYTLKNGTKITSPFYETYGYLNEGLVNPKKPDELYGFVEGAKGIIDKYGLSSKFLTSDSLKKYVKNNVTVADMDERANASRLKAISADPYQVDALIKLGHIASAADLTDFYLDPAIGKEQLDLNRSTGVFAAEALRQAKYGVTFDKATSERYAAQLQAKGLNEAQIGQTAQEAYANIGNILQPEVGLSNIFEGKNAATAATIQSELEAEQLSGLASERRKRLAEQGTRLMQGSAGVFSGRMISYTNQSTAGQL